MLRLASDMQATLTQSPRAESVRWLELVADQVSTLRFGVLQITVHDARVVQLERIEKIRIGPESADVSRKLISADQDPGGNPSTQPTDQTTGGTLR